MSTTRSSTVGNRDISLLARAEADVWDSSGSRSLLYRYGLAVVTIAVTLCVSLLLQTYSISVNITLLVVAAILIPTWFGGIGPGLVVVASFIIVTVAMRPPAAGASLLAYAFSHFSTAALFVVLVFLVAGQRKAALWMSKQRNWLNKTLSSINEGVIATDTSGTITFINPVAERLTGVSAKDAIGNGLREVFKVIDAKEGRPLENPVEKLLRLNLENGLSSQNTLSDSSGQILIIESRASLIKGATGEMMGVVLVFNDLSEKLADEAERKNIEDRYRDLVENALDIIYSHDLEGNYISVNRAGETITGYTAEESLKMNMADIVVPEYINTARAMIAQKLAGNETTAYELDVRAKDGRRITLEVNTRIIKNEGVPVAVQGIARDITARKQAEKALLESETRFQTMVESIKDYGIIMLDPAGVILNWNNGAERITGYKADEIVGQHFSKFYRAEDIELGKPENELKVAAATGRFEDEDNRVRKDGSTFIADIVVTALYNADGDIRGFVKLTRDITDRRQIEAQLRQAQKLEAVGALAGGIAHDFNNLLTAINGFSDLTLLRMSADDPSRRNIEEIRMAGERASELTGQLLAFSRKQVMKPSIHNLNTVISNIEKMLKRIIKENIELRTVLDPELCNIKADPGQIEQVLMNLAINSRDAMPNGGVLSIETRNVFLDEEYMSQHLSIDPGWFVRLTVTDTGHGMDRSVLDRIFEPFFTTKDVGKGTGLGLPTVYGIVKQSGGDITVYSEPGHGTTFKIYLPLVEDDEEKRRWSDDDNLKVGGTETILVVEDEDAVRSLIEEILRANGYVVLSAANGSEALELSASYHREIHLLLTDMIMPKMSGTELARHILEQRPETRIIFMSGYTDDSLIHSEVFDVDDAFIEKPFSPNALARKLREVLDAPTSENKKNSMSDL